MCQRKKVKRKVGKIESSANNWMVGLIEITPCFEIRDRESNHPASHNYFSIGLITFQTNNVLDVIWKAVLLSFFGSLSQYDF